MEFGVGFPLVALADVGEIRDLVLGYENAGFDYISVGGHLLCSRAGRYEGRPEATYCGPYHEPFVLFSFIAALTTRIRMITGISILPLLETSSVAKQSAELSFLSNGRFELGVGISWQEAEYRAVGQDVHLRGARLHEQIELLRLYWTEAFVTFKGRFHDVDDLGLNRIPARPIFIWFGSTFNETAMRRAAKLGDGWMPIAISADAMSKFKDYAAQAGRDPQLLRYMGRMVAGDDGAVGWIAEGKRLQRLGTTHITISAPPGMTLAAALGRLVEAKDALTNSIA